MHFWYYYNDYILYNNLEQGFFNFFVSLKNQITIKVTTKISPNFKSLHYSIHVIYRNFSV